ncbi:MAG TPA: PQQ-binding-like beta-propeller repeat protein [Vicinamibacterales bacterium]|nr:PQQ-binding-like beta-propeller repeat protein [Vicinamibacterales bacterium]
MFSNRFPAHLSAATVALASLVICERAVAQSPDGGAVFARECSSCHTGAPDTRAPAPDVLRRRSPEAILSALTAGAMRPQGGRLTGAERRAVAEYLTGRVLGGDVTGATFGRCASVPPLAIAADAPAWTGWSPSGTNTRYQPAAQAGLTDQTVPKLTLKWAFGFPDATSAWSQPTVAGGRLFVGSQNGTVYALDAKSGCIAWTFAAKSGVRNAPIVAPRAGEAGYAVFFGDTGANVYALDADTGAPLWTRKVDEHPFGRVTGSPTLDEGRLYVPISSLEETAAGQPGYECCSFRGSVEALEASTGAILWKTYLVPEPKPIGKNAAGTTLLAPAGVGVWSSPTVDRKRGVIYVATGNTYAGSASEPTSDALLALDPRSGAIKWIRQFTSGDVFGCRAGTANCLEKAGPDFDFGTPAMLVTRPDGRDIILLGQKSGMAYAVDPDRQGDLLWQYRAGEGSIWGGIQWGMASDGEQLYIPVSDIRTPRPGGLHAVNIVTGERSWFQAPPSLKCTPGAPTCNAALISAPTLIPGVLFSGSNDGGLRAYATKDGSVIWEFDTNQDFTTLNRVRASGGAIQGPGPTIAGGMLYLNAGYGDHLGRPGNVLLAFEVK